MAQGLGIATNTQELIREQSFKKTGGKIPAPPVQALPAQAAPAQEPLAQAGAEQLPPQPSVPVDPAQALQSEAPVPTTPAAQVAQEGQAKSLIPDIRTDPLAALGLLLRNISAGYRGQELPTDILMREQRQNEMTRIAVRMDRANHFMKIMDKGLDIGKEINDPEKRKEIVQAYADNFPMFSDIGDNINKILDSSDAELQFEVLRENMPAVHLLSKGDNVLFDEIINNKQMFDSVLESNARNKRGLLTKKIPEIIQFANATGVRMESVDDLFAINDKLTEPMDALTLDALTRQPGIAARFGLKTQAQAEKDGSGGDPRQITLSKEQVAGLGLPVGTLVQQGDDGNISIVFSPSKPDQRDKRIQNLVDQGLNFADASNIEDEVVDLGVNVKTGRVILTNRITNEVKEIKIEPSEDLGERERPDKSLIELAPQATGVLSALSEIYADTAGQVGLDINTAVVEARQTTETAVAELIRALVIGDNFSVFEMKRIREEVKISPSVFASGEGARSRMRSLDKSLGLRMEQATRDGNDTGLPEKKRSKAISAARDIQNFLDIMGVKEFDKKRKDVPLSPAEQKRFDNILESLRGQ